MKLYLKGLIIMAVTSIVVVFLFVNWLGKYDNNYSVFIYDGHVLSYTSGSTNNQYNFNANEKYRLVEDTIKFTDNSDVEREVNIDNFIHYESGSISVFKKAVLLDFDDLDRDTYRYYNIFKDQILTKNNNKYEIDYINGKLSFKNFIVKINENKYIIVGENIELAINGSKREITDGFIEVTFLDGDIVRICNDSYYTQNVSSDILVLLGDTKLDLSSRNVYYKNEQKLNISEMTIDKDDNIEIPVAENRNGGGSGGGSGQGGSGGSGGSGGGSGDGSGGGNVTTNTDTKPYTVARPSFEKIADGIIDLSDASQEEVVEENSRIKDAYFLLSDFSVEVNSVRGNVVIVDTDSTLSGDATIKVIDNLTGKVVYEKTENGGYSELSIEVDGLKPNTNYILTVNQDYVKNGITYNRDFIQKTFITKDLGIDVVKDYVTSNILSLNLVRDKYSDISRVNVILSNEEGIVIRNENIDFDGDKYNITYTSLDSNTEYTVTLTNYVYSNYSVSGVSDIVRKFKTLKQSPTVGESSFTVDKVNGAFTMNIGTVTDPDKAITKYKYEVYDGRTYSPLATPISTIERENPSSATITFDNVKYKRTIPYLFKVVVTYNDNEKIVEYESPVSDTMLIDGVAFPSVSFANDLAVTYESIVGTLVISDPGNTIQNLSSKSITIIYSSSAGERKTLTSLGRLEIPININNLRKKETYTFSVYASVDLKDNNPAIDNCYIGSVIVDTINPNTLNVEFNTNTSSNNTFSVDVRLTPYNADTTLEATTLTGIRFNLYSGKTTSGELISSVLKVDSDLDYYRSTLKEDYYDKAYNITPEFFNKTNNDLYSDFYTIEVIGAYDYTDYKNELPLVNNVYTIGSNPYFPAYPKDLSNSIEIVPIRNGDYKANKRTDLLDETLVGYKIRAFYDNSRKYAKVIHYFLHDASTDEVIDTYDYEVILNQEPEFVVFNIRDGIVYNQHDGYARRGGEYYFSYTVDMDTDADGTAETTYPTEEEVMLTSPILKPQKQEPVFNVYPSTVTNRTYKLKYYYKDVDSANTTNTITYKLNGIEKLSLPVTSSNNLNTLELIVENNGIITLTIDEALSNDYVSSYSVNTVDFYQQVFESIETNQSNYYRIDKDNNRFRITLVDYDTNSAFYNRIARYDLVFTDLTTNEQVIVPDVKFDRDTYYVDYIEVEDFVGHPIQLDMKYYVDTGIYGFDNEGDYFSIASLRQNYNADQNYYVVGANGRLSFSPIAKNSLFEMSMNHNNKMLTLNNNQLSESLRLSLKLDKNGYSYNYDYILPSKLEVIMGTPYGEYGVSTFDNIIPGVSLTNENGLFDISTTTATVNFKADLYGVSGNRVEDDLIFVTLYSVDNLGNSTEVKTETFEISDFDNFITIDGLEDSQTYKIKFSADIKTTDDTYRRGYLFDVDTGEIGREYTFKTSGSIGIDNISVTYYNATGTYDDRSLLVTYNLNQLSGFQYIKYVIEKRNVDSGGNYVYTTIDNLEIPKSRTFRTNMQVIIPIPVDCGLYTNETYRLSVIPVKELTKDGETVEYELKNENVTFTLDDFYRPYVYVKNDYSSELDTATINFVVTVRNYNGVIVDDKFEIAILDASKQDITPDEYKNVEFSTTNLTTPFSITGVNIGQEYTVVVKYVLNQTNNSRDNLEIEQNIKIAIHNSYGISTGTIYAKQSSNDSSKITLQFIDSSKFDQIKKIRYSIYSSNGENIANETYNFLAVQKIVNGTTIYEYELPTKLITEDSYYLQIQFLVESNEVVSEESLIYNYFS